jgi:hypothetical protein
MIIRSDLAVIRQHTETAFRRSMDEAVGDAKDHAPDGVSRGMKLNAGSVQGGLRASITSEGPERRGDGLYGRIGSPLRYAAQREFGGVILPVRKKMLSWRDPITGKWIFAKRVVQLPGGARQGHKPWLRPAGDKWPDRFAEHLRALG